MIFREYIQRLIDASPVRYYVSGIDGARTWWPWRMNRAESKAFRQAYVEACDHHILDSNFPDESVTNIDVLNEAHKVGSDAAVLADVYQNAPATVDALLDGLELYDDHDYAGTLVLPLQDPHVDVWREVEPAVGGLDVWWAVGGQKDTTAEIKLQKTRALREAIGPDEHIHGLGFGVTDTLARAVRRDPDLLDSIDNSTCIQNVNTQAVRKGAERMSVVAMRATADRVEKLRNMTHYAADADDPAQIRQPGQSGLDELMAGSQMD